MTHKQIETTIGVMAIAGYCLHAIYLVWRGEPENLLWICHLASLIVGCGFLASSHTLVGMGTIVLCLGTPLWLLELSQGGEFLPTSLGTHVLGLLLGLYGVWSSGIGKGTWWKATAFFSATIGLARLITPAVSNVNLAFAVPPGMDRYFYNHLSYLAFTVILACAYFWIVEILLRSLMLKIPGGN